MSRIKCKDTKPEIKLRSELHRIGFRFRKNVTTLPGKPDILLPKFKLSVFVNGCFGDQHNDCKKALFLRLSVIKSSYDPNIEVAIFALFFN